MTLTLWPFAFVPVGLVGALLLHELTHYLVARVFGIEAWFEQVTTVAYHVEGDRPTWQYRMVGLAPQVVGVAAGMYYLVRWGVPWSPTGVVLVGSWAMYTVGSYEDLSVRAARGETPRHRVWWRELDDVRRRTYAMLVPAVAAGCVGMAASATGYPTLMYSSFVVLTGAPMGFFAAAR